MKLLLADDDPERAQALMATLAADPQIRVVRIARDELLADAVARAAPDVVLVDMTRPDRDALEGLSLLSARHPHPVVLFVDEDDPAFMEAAIAAGVCSYNVGTLAPAQVRPLLRAAVALFRQQQTTRAALDAAEQRLRERATVDRAKMLLMRDRRLSEPQAHRLLQKQAMETSRRLVDVAAEWVERIERRDAS